MDLSVCLKVKLKSLAEEARIIRKEEKKNKRLRYLLSEHRRGTVRLEARHTHIAYGFIRGKTYEQIEPKCKTPVEWDRVRKMVTKYGVQWNHWDGESCRESRERRSKLLIEFDKWAMKAQKHKSLV
jgi:hypothetical protein